MLLLAFLSPGPFIPRSLYLRSLSEILLLQLRPNLLIRGRGGETLKTVLPSPSDTVSYTFLFLVLPLTFLLPSGAIKQPEPLVWGSLNHKRILTSVLIHQTLHRWDIPWEKMEWVGLGDIGIFSSFILLLPPSREVVKALTVVLGLLL